MIYTCFYRLSRYMSCLFLLLACWLTSEEKLFCPFDGRTWKIGFQEHIENESMIELVLQNEDISDWTELITIQSYKNLPFSAGEFIHLIEQSAKKHVPKNQEFNFKLIAEDPDNVFQSSFIVNHAQFPSLLAYDEYNIGRILRGKTILYYLRYSTKDAHLFEQNKEGWLDRFELAYLASSPRSDQQGQWLTFTNEGVYENHHQLVFQPSKRFINRPKIGFSFSLPKDWVADNQESKETDFDAHYPYTVSLLFSSPDEKIYGGVAFLDLPSTMNPSKFHPRAYYIKLFKKQYPQAKLVKEGQLQTTLGQEGSYILLVEGDKVGWVTFWINSQRIYRLELWLKKSEFKNLKKDLEKIILNFKLLPFQPLLGDDRESS